MTDQRENRLQEVGKGALSSIRCLVAALECDYERLEELRDERDAHDSAEDHADDADVTLWATENPDEATELAELEEAAAGCDTGHPCTDRDDAEQRIHEDALSVRVFGERTDNEWSADRFELLLCTGGPAVRIMGELDEHGEPDRAWLEVQDWGTPWTEYYETGVGELCLKYAQCFYFAG